MAKPTYESPEEAARASTSNKAISQPKTIQTTRGQYRVLIVHERGKTPYYVYAGALYHVLPDTLARPSTKDIDAEKRWKPW
jgi:hypothetical protein